MRRHTRFISQQVNRRWTPADDDRIGLWLDGMDASTFTVSAGNITAWRDKTTNRNDFTQGTASQQPIYDPNTLGIKCKDNRHLFIGSATNLLASNGEHICLLVHDIYDPTASTNSFPPLFRLSAAVGGFATRRPWWFYNKSGDNIVHSVNSSGGSVVSNTSTFTGKRVVCGRQTASTNFTDIDGGTWSASTAITPDTSTAFSYGQVGDYSSQNLDIVVNEVVFLAGVSDLATCERMTGYLAWKWGLADNLPLSHPYRFNPPLK